MYEVYMYNMGIDVVVMETFRHLVLGREYEVLHHPGSSGYCLGAGYMHIHDPTTVDTCAGYLYAYEAYMYPVLTAKGCANHTSSFELVSERCPR